MKKESHPRSLVKAITWRVIASLTTMSLVYVFTGKVLLSLGIGALEIMSKLFFYYLHERAWGKIAWGQIKHCLEDIKLKKMLTPEDKEKIIARLKELGYL